jgi:hypothetical protein
MDPALESKYLYVVLYSNRNFESCFLFHISSPSSLDCIDPLIEEPKLLIFGHEGSQPGSDTSVASTATVVMEFKDIITTHQRKSMSVYIHI